MKLRDLAAVVNAAIEDGHGDLDVLDTAYFQIDGIDIETSEGQFSKDWNMPNGFQFVRINKPNFKNEFTF